jgi:predicted nucleic acid-binding protein
MGALMADRPRYYLDTNVLIAIGELRSVSNARQVQMMDDIAAGTVEAVSSEFALSECLVKPIAEGDMALARMYDGMLSGGSEIMVSQVTRAVLVEAARIRAAHKIKLPDAIHFATAQLDGCSAFVTNDHRLGSVWGASAIIWDAL